MAPTHCRGSIVLFISWMAFNPLLWGNYSFNAGCTPQDNRLILGWFLPFRQGNVLIILVDLKIILSDFPVVWGVLRVTESARKIRNPAVWGGTPRTNTCLICRLSRETKPYSIRKQADRRRTHNKRMAQHKHIYRRGRLFLNFFSQIEFIVIYIFPLT